MKLKFIIILFIFFIFKTAFSQTQEKIYKDFHLSLNFKNIYTKYRHENIVGDLNIISPSMSGFLFGANLMYNLTKSFGIETGILIQKSFYNHYIPPDLYNGRSPYTISIYNYSFPFNIEYHLQLKEKLFVAPKLGLNISRYQEITNDLHHTSFVVVDSSGNYNSIIGVITSKGTPKISIDFTLNFVYAFKNKYLIKFGPAFRYFKENEVSVYYKSEIPELNYEGILYANGSFYGLNFVFVFANLTD